MPSLSMFIFCLTKTFAVNMKKTMNKTNPNCKLYFSSVWQLISPDVGNFWRYSNIQILSVWYYVVTALIKLNIREGLFLLQCCPWVHFKNFSNQLYQENVCIQDIPKEHNLWRIPVKWQNCRFHCFALKLGFKQGFGDQLNKPIIATKSSF